MPACIDWEDYFDEPSDNSNGGALYATIREAYKNQIVDTVLWTQLYQAARQKIKKINVASIVDELDYLKSKYLQPKLQDKHLATKYFEGDFRVFIQFMILQQASSINSYEPISLETLWESDVNAHDRYQQITLCLLKCAKKNILEESLLQRIWTSADLASLNDSLEKYSRLTRTCLPHFNVVRETNTANSTSSEPKNILKFLKKLLKQLLERLWMLLQKKVSPEHKMYSEVASRFVTLLKTVPILNSAEQEQAIIKLKNWYEVAKNHYETKPSLASKHLSHLLSESKTRKGLQILHRWTGWRLYFNTLEEELTIELENIKQLGEYAFRTTLMKCTSEREILQDYIKTDEIIQARVRQWYQTLFDLRMALEKQLRSNENTYLDNLNSLDTIFETLYNKSISIRKNWLINLETHAFLHHTTIELTQKCLGVIYQSEVQQLNWAQWLHHTCDAYLDTEGALAYEMATRNRKANKRYFQEVNEKDVQNAKIAYTNPSDYKSAAYNLLTAYTMSDYAVDNLMLLNKNRRRLLNALHPDKYTQNHNVRDVVATYCTQQLLQLSDQSFQWINIWRDGVWNGTILEESEINPATKIELMVQSIQLNQGESTWETPNRPLDIATFISLHQAYVKNLQEESRPNAFHKERRLMPSCQVFFNGAKNDPLKVIARENREHRRQEILREKAEQLINARARTTAAEAKANAEAESRAAAEAKANAEAETNKENTIRCKALDLI